MTNGPIKKYKSHKALQPSDMIRVGVDGKGKNIYASASDASRAKAADKAQSKAKLEFDKGRARSKRYANK